MVFIFSLVVRYESQIEQLLLARTFIFLLSTFFQKQVILFPEKTLGNFSLRRER